MVNQNLLHLQLIMNSKEMAFLSGHQQFRWFQQKFPPLRQPHSAQQCKPKLTDEERIIQLSLVEAQVVV